MSYSKPQICCPNPNCAAPLNPLGSVACGSCQTPLIYRYLWAVGPGAEQLPAGTHVAGRYYVTAPQIWLDTQPSLPPDVPAVWADAIVPYLHLYPQRLHVPDVYGFCPDNDVVPANTIFLLENAPLDAKGNLYPTLTHSWPQATPVRQVYWLWQMLQLWQPLVEQSVASSLLAPNNIRVDGWRIRFCQLFCDIEVLTEPGATDEALAPPGLVDLANRWLEWIDQSHEAVKVPLQAICHQMQTGATFATVSAQLNQLLLEQAAQLPLRLQIAGATDTGPQRSHNEDACYPLTLGGKAEPDGLGPRLAIVCDGIGGHEGGEVASQTAVRSLTLQIQALLTEVGAQTDVIPPDLLYQQLEAVVRVANNLIASQNDAQGREGQRRMGTTLVMALQVPQRIAIAADGRPSNGHELYLVHVGDSRAYWITPRYCHQLTVDDDVSTREVRLGRSLYREVLHRPDAGALTQALGTRDADYLRPTIQRFILEEDGLLLLCSDGLSDNNLVEQHWADYADAILKGQHSLDLAVKNWLDLANQKNGHDNTSIVLLHCHVSSPLPEVSLPVPPGQRRPASEWSPASRALLQNEPDRENVAASSSSSTVPHRSHRRLVIGLIIALLLGAGAGIVAWSRFNPHSFQQFRERVHP